jgi:uncharacterized protein YndB with AHSA1/START domain
MKRILALTITLLCLSIPARASDNMEVLTDKIIKKSRTVDCSIDTMWWKWTTHDGLRTFFGEDNNMELQIGGPFEIYFSNDVPEGSRGSEGCKVISYLPKEMISFSWNAPPKFPDIRNGDYHTWVVVTFKAVKGNRTEVRINHLGWLKGEDWDQVYQYFDKAWVTVLDWLEKSCKK